MKALTADEHTRLERFMLLREPVSRATTPERALALVACTGIFTSTLALYNYVTTKEATRGTRAEAYVPGTIGADLEPLPRAPFDADWDLMDEAERARAWQEIGGFGTVPDVDLSAGIGDRLETGMKARRLVRRRKG